MTLEEIKDKTFSLIEEYDEDAEELTNDEDLANKINGVINQIQNELSRIKKIPKLITLDVEENQTINLKKMDKSFYQLDKIRDVEYIIDSYIVTFREEGTATIIYYVYPEQIDRDTEDDFELNLDIDVLEIMPYGIAADLLKSDVSNSYGNIYRQRYEELKQNLDPRYSINAVTIKGGYEI